MCLLFGKRQKLVGTDDLILSIQNKIFGEFHEQTEQLLWKEYLNTIFTN
jgi:hypothetical protein